MKYSIIRTCYQFFHNRVSSQFTKYAIDLISILASYSIAKLILGVNFTDYFYQDLFFLTVIGMGAAYALKIEQQLWRFASLHTLFEVLKYGLIVSGLFFAFQYLHYKHFKIALLFSIIFAAFFFTALNMSRILLRLIFERARQSKIQGDHSVIVLGAGKGAELFIRESMKCVNGYRIQGILDDDPNLWGNRIFGIKIYGPIKDLEKLASFTEVQAVVVAIPSLNAQRLQEITEVAEALDLQVKILPSFERLLINQDISPEDISIEDLLGRDPITLGDDEISSFIQGKNVLITGAGGSIGAELSRQLIKLNPASIILLDHSEYNLYKIAWEFEHLHKYPHFAAVLANITDEKVMEKVFQDYSPDVIFHAAAYKHVPLLEKQARQAISNNFLGTKIVAELASKYKAEEFILISTDKAVNPTNVLGSTKRMAEIFCQNFNQESQTRFVIVRFGNVLGSAGSVIPLFKKQLKQGGPLTVTHPDITRFFMSIPEASQLVIQAGAMGEGGEIFVLDMGSPVKIKDLAERLINLTGKRPYKDVDIVFTGLRPGEKLYEELFYEEEAHASTKRDKIFSAQKSHGDYEDFQEHAKVLEKSLDNLAEEKLIEMIAAMVPEANMSQGKREKFGVDYQTQRSGN